MYIEMFEQEAFETTSMKPKLWLRYSHLMAPQPFGAWLDLWLSTPGMSLENGYPIAFIATGVIYSILCSVTKSMYIGVTDRILSTQCSEHRRQLINRKIEDSAVAIHASGNYHNIDWKNSIILDHEDDFFKRLKEALLIQWHNNFNQDVGLAVTLMWTMYLHWYDFCFGSVRLSCLCN